MLITFQFIGRLHPVLVHLPIGALLIACILHWLSLKQRFRVLQQAVSIILLVGTLAAIASTITGYTLSTNEDYDHELVNAHQWLGISTTMISGLFYFLHRQNAASRVCHAMSFVLLLLIMVTGHLGGSLTHGSDYLSFTSSGEKEIQQKPIADVQEAVVYTDIVQPLLQNKCYSCHGKNKQKGGLRLDDSAHIWKGGKDGIVLVSGKADESEVIKRLLLPRNHEDHMPPKEKSQLNEQEIALLHWWIASGTPFHKKVKELAQPENVKSLLLSLQKSGSERTSVNDIPASEAPRADTQAINRLRRRGVVILPVAQNNNYLMANFVTADSIRDSDLQLLIPLKEQLVWLKLGNTLITDSSLYLISIFKNVSRLQLDHTNVTDIGLSYLQSMKNLQYLNLVGTKVTLNGVLSLKKLSRLQSLYLYQTQIKSAEWLALKNNFPNTLIDSGGYTVPVFGSDTSEVKPRKKADYE